MLIAVIAVAGFGNAWEQTPPFPNRPLRSIVGQRRGFTPDIVARMVAERPAEVW